MGRNGTELRLSHRVRTFKDSFRSSRKCSFIWGLHAPINAWHPPLLVLHTQLWRCAKIKLDEHLSGEEAESRMGARVEYGEGARALEVKVGIIAVLPTSCEAALSTHCCAAVR